MEEFFVCSKMHFRVDGNYLQICTRFGQLFQPKKNIGNVKMICLNIFKENIFEAVPFWRNNQIFSEVKLEPDLPSS